MRFVFFATAYFNFASCLLPVHFDGSRYYRYPSTSSVASYANVIEFRFRTVYSSGSIVLLVGQDYETLFVQLVGGQLRYAISDSRHHAVLLGNYLNDNKWHYVKVTRNGRISELVLDNITEVDLASSIFQKVSFNGNIFIAGIAEDMGLGGKNFIGCLTGLKIDRRETQFDFKNPRQNNTCQNSINSAMELLTPSSSVVINAGALSAGFSVALHMRTFSFQGIIAYAHTDICSHKLSIKDGKICLEMGHNSGFSGQKLICDIAPVSNGEWHSIEVKVSSSVLLLSVDGFQTNMFVYGACDKANTIFLGGQSTDDGLVGCLYDVVLQGTKVHFKGSQIIYGNNHVQYNGVREGCGFESVCFPNPCRNGGQCTQSSAGIYYCDCNKTEFYGRLCEISIYKLSCAQYRLSQKSFCILKNGSTVLCQANKDTELKTTVHHNMEARFDPAITGTVFQSYRLIPLKYDINADDIKRLKERSDYCRQKVVYNCFNAFLLNAPRGPPNVAWRSDNKRTKMQWGAVGNDSVGCACGLNQTCSNPSKLCNCDSMNDRWATDWGYITDTRYLPVTRFDVTGLKVGSSYLNVGPLDCFQKFAKEELPESILKKVCVSTREVAATIANTNRSIVVDVVFNDESVNRSETQSNDGQTFYTDSPPTQPNPESMSILETFFITAAALAVVILLTKLVVCKVLKERQGEFVLDEQAKQKRRPLLFRGGRRQTSDVVLKPNMSITSYCV